MKDKRNPILTAFMVLKNKSTPLIVRSLSSGSKRLTEIENYVSCLNRKAVAESLQYLEDTKIIAKDVFVGTNKILTAYKLTDLGKAILPISDELENKFEINWKDIEILNDEKGRPYVNILNNKIQNIEDIDISLSHCKQYAIANVVVIFK